MKWLQFYYLPEKRVIFTKIQANANLIKKYVPQP